MSSMPYHVTSPTMCKLLPFPSQKRNTKKNVTLCYWGKRVIMGNLQTKEYSLFLDHCHQQNTLDIYGAGNGCPPCYA